jgi:predicted GIY-YIG superfamily endonuclease
MIIAGCKKDKCVYAYEFSDRSVYVGITNNIQRRTSDRKRRPYDTVTRYTNESGLIPIHKQLTELLPVEEAVFLEAKFVEEYKNNNWYILNKAKTGGVGGDVLYWTKEKCLTEGLKFKYRSDFNLHSKGAYCSARYNDWLPEIYSHMIELQKPNNYWTYENCKQEALKYNTRTEFRKKCSWGYIKAKRNNWLDEICQHMIIIIRTKKVWTLEECKQEALKYTTKYDFRTKSNKIYDIAQRNKWLNEICQHMIIIKKSKWTKEICLENALKYDNRFDWRINEKTIYNAASKNGWMKDCVKHMKTFQKEIFWTKEVCMIDAKKYNRPSDWQKNSAGHQIAWKNGWLEECCKHMTEKSISWTIEKCIASALKYPTRTDWWLNERSAYSTAVAKGWLQKCTVHMRKKTKFNKPFIYVPVTVPSCT